MELTKQEVEIYDELRENYNRACFTSTNDPFIDSVDNMINTVAEDYTVIRVLSKFIAEVIAEGNCEDFVTSKKI